MGESYWYVPEQPIDWIDGYQACWEPSTGCQSLAVDIQESSWVGLGGYPDKSNNLAQEGESVTADTNSGSYSGQIYYAWVENIGNVLGATNYNATYGYKAYDVDWPTILPGDEFYGATYQDDGSGSAEMYVDDTYHSNEYATYAYGPDASGYTFECIQENNGDGNPLTEDKAQQTQMDTESVAQCDGELADTTHHAVGSASSYAWFDYQLEDLNHPSPTDIDQGGSWPVCGSGCGDGSFTITNATLSNGDGS